MDENLGIAIVNDRLIFFSIFGAVIALIAIILIGIKNGWWSLKSKKGEISGKKSTVNKVEEIYKSLEERDNKWYNVLNLQAKYLQELDDDKVNVRHDCLVKQLGYLDDTFDSEETTLRIKLAGELDRKSEKVQLAEYRFESTFHKTKREIIQVVKDNNLLQSSVEELKEKMRKRARKNTDFFRKDAPFYPIPIDEKIIEEYSEFVERAAEDGIVHARMLAEKREEDLKKLYEEYDEKIKQIIKREIPDINLGEESGEEKEERIG